MVKFDGTLITFCVRNELRSELGSALEVPSKTTHMCARVRHIWETVKPGIEPNR